MYSQLIYTRCGEGIDLLRENVVKSAGFKVYSFSKEVKAPGVADLTFLNAAAQTKPPFAEPSFMDDAYLYLVPDHGGRFLINSHPIVRDGSGGSYSQRGGNFINQILVGDFSDTYPYETFGNPTLWDAKKKGEAYYYENTPTHLPLRHDLSQGTGEILLDDIAAFVRDGRREAVKAAIAFLISQYELPAKERKFLMIRDEDEKLIELWIAAIQRGFSPRMASGLPFATRMDKPTTANKYTVNLAGQYQTQINLQSPQQELRYRGMIVGVDERDRSNASAVKPMPNSPYVILDGKTKALSVPMDTSDPYFQFITNYTDTQEFVCREFFQMVDLCAPSASVKKLYTAYESFARYGTSGRLKDLQQVLSVLGGFSLLKTPLLEKLYKGIKAEIPKFLREDAAAALSVMTWLESVSTLMADHIAKNQFTEQVCRSYGDSLFLRPQGKPTAELHAIIMNSPFGKRVVEYCTSETTINAYQKTLQAYRTEEWISFIELFMKGARLSGRSFPTVAEGFLLRGIQTAYTERNTNGAERIVSIYAEQDKERTTELILRGIGNANNQSLAAFFVQLLCRVCPDILATENSLSNFGKKLRAYGLESQYATVLANKAQSIRQAKEMERFLSWILADKNFDRTGLSSILNTLDKKLSVADPDAVRVAGMLQKYRGETDMLIVSAHIHLLTVLDGKGTRGDMVRTLKDLVSQGVPSMRNHAYGEELAKKLMDPRTPYEAVETVVTEGIKLSFYADLFAREAMKYAGTKHNEVAVALFEIGAKTASGDLFDGLVKACGSIKQFDKAMEAIRADLRAKGARQLFAEVEAQARTIHDQNKETSFFKRLFCRKSRDDEFSNRG